MLSTLSFAAVTVLAAIALPNVNAASRDDYIANARSGINKLNSEWYDSSNGLWQEMWWNSANMVTTLADFVALDPDQYLSSFIGQFETTLTAAAASNGGNFINDYYDDEGWWAMAWVDVYDLTHNSTYLEVAQDIFSDMVKGDDATCGGHWWSKDNDANTAIGNELYLAVAASLANRASNSSEYADIAKREVDWFLQSGMINDNHTVNDGLNLTSCTVIGPTYTYNSGVILGALFEMHTLTSNQTYLDIASSIAHGATTTLVDSDGILTEVGYPSPPDTNGAQFKGIFARNLAYLQSVAGDDAYVSFLQKNADSLWSTDRKGNSLLGPFWQGPYEDANAASQSSALDCLVGAAAVS
jgi:predicted alpha-1,6-mannanase (GH76 family)